MTAQEAPALLRQPVHLTRLTDEELVLLGGTHPLVQLPHHDRLDETEQTQSLRAALRGLRSRGLDLADDGRSVEVPQHLADLLDVRSGARQVLLVQVLRPPGPGRPEPWASDHYAYVVDDFVLLEDVVVEGLHEFWALDLDGLAAALQDRLPDVGAADGTGPPVEADLPAVAAGADTTLASLLGTPLLQVDAAVWHAPGTSDPELLAVLLGDRGSCAAAAVAGATGPTELEPLPVAGVGERVVALLAAGTMPG
ncbi:hypothetical protein [Barrientosiimonas endolithica]|uniref:Uncharacterized protein n=1 Tax=Barrientosiimonas endolithica TaxID=1535208 RepID=A0ABN6YRE9_9MICO|nr:hypothetical protein [Barrientosiimonas endolithica]BDZ58610.1 hypothetical protein GCM10025872_22670 [Barrientosiimonas endolithica]